MGYVPPRPMPVDDTGHPWETLSPWEAWFAWHPVLLTRTKKLVWLKGVYRRIDSTRIDYDGNTRTQYGDAFDILMM